MTAVLLLFAATHDPAAAIDAALGSDDVRGAFEAAAGRAVDVDLVTWNAPARAVAGVRSSIVLSAEKRTPIDRVFGTTGVTALRDRLATFPAGRLLNSLGPADAARVFWRGLRASQAAMALTGAEVLVVAGDLPATRAAWYLLRSGRAARALWGVRAAADDLSATGSRPARP